MRKIGPYFQLSKLYKFLTGVFMPSIVVDLISQNTGNTNFATDYIS